MDKIRANYDLWHQHKISHNVTKAEQEINNRILASLRPEKGRLLLDIGCGKGSFCNAAFDIGLEVYGVDFSVVALKEAKIFNKNIGFILADAMSLSYGDESFDYVTCLGSLEHFSNKNYALAEIFRVMKKNGKAYILLPNSYFIGHIYMVCKTGLPPDEAGQQFSEDFNTRLGWKSILEEKYFTVSDINNFNTIWASEKVSQLTKYIYNFAIRPFIPLNLSYAFGYLCLKKLN